MDYSDIHFTLAFNYGDKRLLLKKDDIDLVAIYENEIFYNIVEKEGESAEMINEQVSPDVYITRDIAPATRCIRRPLPEQE